MADSQQRYRVVEKLESGGMAEVFRAESEGLQGFKKQVAIKRVLPHLSEKKRFISMFLDEARLSAHLSHSNCVQVFDIGVGDNAYFIVMEFVDGANLKSIAEALKKAGHEFPVSAAVFIAIEICKGLAYAHELRDPQGTDLHIVHRDMSPPNVLVTKYGEVKIVDFGLAKANSQLEKSEPGIIKGKFSYLSPEAAMGQEVDARTDIFAVGIILWELLAGQRLFLGDTDFQTVKKVQQAQIPSISAINKGVPPELEKIINRSLARDPNARYRLAKELARDLNNFLFDFGQPVSSFDIAQLVVGAMKEKQRKKPQQGSIIDKLIEEALFEFTSLTDDKGAPQANQARKPSAEESQATAPLDLGAFVDPKSWIDDMALDQPKHTPSAALSGKLPANVTAGNLSALEEDDDPPMPPPSGPSMGAATPSPPPPAMTPAPAPVAAPRPPAPMGQAAGPGSSQTGTPAKSGGSGAIIAVVLLVLVAGGVAGAWFGGIIPH